MLFCVARLLQFVHPCQVFGIALLIGGIADTVQFTALPACKGAFDLDGGFLELFRCIDLRAAVIDVKVCFVYCSQPALVS